MERLQEIGIIARTTQSTVLPKPHGEREEGWDKLTVNTFRLEIRKRFVMHKGVRIQKHPRGCCYHYF